MERGYVKLEGAVPQPFVAEATANVWQRLGYDPARPETWTEQRVHMPAQRTWHVSRVAPIVYGTMEELTGGGRLLPPMWNDSFVVNLGLGSDRPWQGLSTAQEGWHTDGDFFRHFLDSPEQALLVIVLYTDVFHRGGATVFLPESVGPVARFLADRPGGCLPDEMDYAEIVAECGDVVEATGRAGDVYLLHPYMVHASSQNVLRAPRIIANPGNALREPMRFDRREGEHSAVEQAVLMHLGVDLLSFTRTREREAVEPERVALQAARKMLEDARLSGTTG